MEKHYLSPRQMNNSFDIDNAIANMSESIKEVFGDHWPEIKDRTQAILLRRSKRLETLVSLKGPNEEENTEFNARIRDEERLFEANLHAISSRGKASAKRAAQAAITAFNQSITGAL